MVEDVTVKNLHDGGRALCGYRTEDRHLAKRTASWVSNYHFTYRYVEGLLKINNSKSTPFNNEKKRTSTLQQYLCTVENEPTRRADVERACSDKKKQENISQESLGGSCLLPQALRFNMPYIFTCIHCNSSYIPAKLFLILFRTAFVQAVPSISLLYVTAGGGGLCRCWRITLPVTRITRGDWGAFVDNFNTHRPWGCGRLHVPNESV
ncbi:hypothetical protein EVAR_96656_1 [Eumeta japonica]|uniref:Uncharacterized protein n=1 Tax=Eumeta variegata TaxID=151549 RepID=A0A4C2A2X4_EUMVA|nr:hypothetical protein EVAR_96656_1 [Eumeta japonica]